MSEIQSTNLQYPELDEEALTALTYLDWRVSSQSDQIEDKVEVAIHDPGVIVGILGSTIMSRIAAYERPEDITVLTRVQNTKVPPLGYTSAEWIAFLAGCKKNEFDPLTES